METPRRIYLPLKKDIEVLIVAPACTPLPALNIIEVTGKAFTLMFAALKCLATQSPGCHSHKSDTYLNKFIWEKYQNDTEDTHLGFKQFLSEQVSSPRKQFRCFKKNSEMRSFRISEFNPSGNMVFQTKKTSDFKVSLFIYIIFQVLCLLNKIKLQLKDRTKPNFQSFVPL